MDWESGLRPLSGPITFCGLRLSVEKGQRSGQLRLSTRGRQLGPRRNERNVPATSAMTNLNIVMPR